MPSRIRAARNVDSDDVTKTKQENPLRFSWYDIMPNSCQIEKEKIGILWRVQGETRAGSVNTMGFIDDSIILAKINNRVSR